MYIKQFLIITFFFFWPIIYLATPIIQLTFIEDQEAIAKKMEKRVKRDGTVGKHGFNHLVDHNPVAGVFVAYAGAMDVSDHLGHTIFSRKHSDSDIYLVITSEIIPFVRFGNTINHWTVANAPAGFYRLATINEDGRLWWTVEELKIPDNKVIPSEAVVIIGDPSNFSIVVDDESFPVEISPNILLPPIIVRKGVHGIKAALYLLAVRHLFSQSTFSYKKEGKMLQMVPAL